MRVEVYWNASSVIQNYLPTMKVLSTLSKAKPIAKPAILQLKSRPERKGSFLTDVIFNFAISRKSKSHARTPNVPLYQKHGDPFSKSFILPQDMDESHQPVKIQIVSQLQIGKPRVQSTFCWVCRQSYEDYVNHINSACHKNCIKKAIFEKDLHELFRKLGSPNVEVINRKQRDITANISKNKFSALKKRSRSSFI